MFGHDRENQEQQRKIESQITANIQLYKRVFGGEDGKAVLQDLEKRCFINHTTFNDNHGQMSFNEGRRSIFVYIKNLLEKDLTQILEDLTKNG
jgi:hypothetical protein